MFSLLPSPDRSRLLSLSMDRNLIVWDVSAARPELRLASLGGFAYAVACSPVEPGKVLVGVGDNTLRVWNTAGKDVYDCASPMRAPPIALTALRPRDVAQRRADQDHRGVLPPH